MSDASDSAPSAPPSKSTGPLVQPVEATPAEVPRLPLEPIHANLPDRNFFLRLGELVIFLVAVVGSVALGLAITSYFRAHTYIAAYLLAYAGFRCADLLVREEYGPDPTRDALSRRIADQAPLLILFFAAPFERTYLYGGEAPRWISGLALGVGAERAMARAGRTHPARIFFMGAAQRHRAAGAGAARLLSLHSPSGVRGNLPRTDRMADRLWRADFGGARRHHRGDRDESSHQAKRKRIWSRAMATNIGSTRKRATP